MNGGCLFRPAVYNAPCPVFKIPAGGGMDSFGCSFESEFGTIRLVWNGASGRIMRVLFPGQRVPDIEPVRAEDVPERVSELMSNLGRFLRGAEVEFDPGMLDLESCSPFKRRVLLLERTIPRGCVTTYGALARELGTKGGARAVGGALASNPLPLIIPCHRVVRSDGSIGGFQGGGVMKEKLLVMEGVKFLRKGIVDPRFIIVF